LANPATVVIHFRPLRCCTRTWTLSPSAPPLASFASSNASFYRWIRKHSIELENNDNNIEIRTWLMLRIQLQQKTLLGRLVKDEFSRYNY
jgi:hypothetical protein